MQYLTEMAKTVMTNITPRTMPAIEATETDR